MVPMQGSASGQRLRCSTINDMATALPRELKRRYSAAKGELRAKVKAADGGLTWERAVSELPVVMEVVTQVVEYYSSEPDAA